MSEKRDKILATALKLFANESYNTTVTSKIAKKAEVSEGLIFKHFKNKKGLLDAIIAEATEQAKLIIDPILDETNPKEVIRKTIHTPFQIQKENRDYWMLQSKLKWQKEYNNPNIKEPIIEKLAWALTELNNPEPEKEAILLIKILEAICISLMRDKATLFEDYEDFILKKYLNEDDIKTIKN